MLVWRGFGLLAILPFALALIFQVIMGDASVYSALGYILGALPIWYLGLRFNSKPPELQVDEATGKQSLSKELHSFFWIKMEYWAIIYVMIGLYVLSTETQGSALVLFTGLLGIASLGFLAYQVYLRAVKGRQASTSTSSTTVKTFNPAPKKVYSNRDKIDKAALNSSTSTFSQESKQSTLKSSIPKEIINEMKELRGKEKQYSSSDHSKYMPAPKNKTTNLESTEGGGDLNP